MTQRKTVVAKVVDTDIGQRPFDTRLTHYERTLMREAAANPLVQRTPLNSATLISEMHEHTNHLRVWAYKALGLRQ